MASSELDKEYEECIKQILSWWHVSVTACPATTTTTTTILSRLNTFLYEPSQSLHSRPIQTNKYNQLFIYKQNNNLHFNTFSTDI